MVCAVIPICCELRLKLTLSVVSFAPTGYVTSGRAVAVRKKLKRFGWVTRDRQTDDAGQILL